MMLLLAMIMAWSNINASLLKDRFLHGQLARHDLITFARLTSPLASDPNNPRASQYRAAAHHHYIAKQLQRVESGEVTRLMISLPYRHGKTELGVRKFVPWLMGRTPAKSVICVTHTDGLAWEHGRDVRNHLRGPGWRTTFHEKAAQLRDDSQARDRLQMEGGGTAMFTGRSGLGGGFGADIIIFDDFFKNAEEAQSQATRDHAWQCYISDCKSRLNESTGAVVMIGTRKHEDDVQGRILDPTNLNYDPKEAAQWEVIRLPALAEDNDPLGRAVDEPLWPQRFPYDFWNDQRTNRSELVREDFQIQGQCNPTPTEGKYFKKDWLKIYRPEELPKDLRIYAASDHAYRKDQSNDRQCLLVVGVDASGTIWLLPDTWWERADTGEMVEAMINLIASRQPVCWWAARDAISGSVGPFLNKRMKERNVFGWVNDDLREDKDLQRRAQSIRNRMAMGMIRFPVFAPWWAQAEKELMTFPNGKHDDLIAALAMLGMGLDQMHGADGPWKPSQNFPKPQTMAWVKGEVERTAAEAAAEKENKGW